MLEKLGDEAVMSFESNSRISARDGERGCVTRSRGAGFTLIELVVVVAIVLLISAMAAPYFRNMVRMYRLNAAASSVSGLIQSTRYQSITVGCPYTLAFTAGSIMYQVQTQNITGNPPTCSTTFSNVGSALPWSTTTEVAISQSTTLQFNPSGTVQANTGALTFNLTLGTMTKAFTVSGVGNVSIISK